MLEAIFNGITTLVDAVISTVSWMFQGVAALPKILTNLVSVPVTFSFMHVIFPTWVWHSITVLLGLAIALTIFRLVTRFI